MLWLRSVGETARGWTGCCSLRNGTGLLIVYVLLGSVVIGRGQVDVNGNGLSDVWEMAYGAVGLAPDGDADGDGQSNYQESVAGTDPQDAQSVFRVSACQFVDAAYLIRWPSVPGKRYQVETTNALTGGNWQPQGSPVHGTGGYVLGVVTNLTPPPEAFRLRLLVDNPAVLNSRSLLLDLDTDGDGVADIDEYAAGTNPFDATSFLAIESIHLGSAVLLSWPSVVGKRYQIQSRAEPPASWLVAGEVLEGDGTVLTAAVAVTESCRLFRVGVADVDTDLDGVTDWEEQLAGLQVGPLNYRTNSPTAATTVTAILAATNRINLEVGTAVANVTTLTPGSVRVTRAGNLNRLTVHYVVGGDAVPGVDYVALPGTITLPGGVNEIEIPVTPLAGAVLSPAKTVRLTVQPDTNYEVGPTDSRDVSVLQEAALSVQDFGAVGDGVTDDTAAVQAAIEALEASSNHNTLHFPTGTYRLNTTSWEFDDIWGWYQKLLKLGNADLAGRDLLLTGDPGAVLYSTVNTNRTRMLVVPASFRSLTFRGLTWRKENIPLPFPPDAGEPNRAEGVWLRNQDLRQVEAVDFLDCTFENCHGALLAGGYGYDLRGRLAHLGFTRCRVLNPYGSNTTNAWAALGGGQQVRLTPWVGYAIYRDNLFDGGSDNPDPVLNPGGIRKDGCHFGSPLHLLFTNNVVRHMGVEAVYQTDDPYMGATADSFTIPPPDGTTTAQATLLPIASTYQVGQLLNFRTWFNGVSPGVNVFLSVVAYDASNRVVTVSNHGLTAGVEGMVIPGYMPIYLEDYNPTFATIAGNIVDGGEPGGASGITALAKATITGNFIAGYGTGVYQYDVGENPLFPPMLGVLIDSNVILTHNSTQNARWAYGIQSYGPGEIIANNLIITPATYRFVGIAVRGHDFWVESNTVLPIQVMRQSYGVTWRSVGIGFGNGTAGSTAVANHTYGMDVGIGPENPYQITPHRVISHFSTNDVLAIDPRGLMSN